jgi:hypothetical protein
LAAGAPLASLSHTAPIGLGLGGEGSGRAAAGDGRAPAV